MTPAKILLAASVAFNVGLLTLLVLFFSTAPVSKPAISPPLVPGEETGDPASGPERAELHPEAETGETDRSPEATPATRRTTHFRKLFDQLRTAGMTENQAKRVVAAAAMAEWHESMERGLDERGRDDFWRIDLYTQYHGFFSEMVQKRREIEEALMEATGSDLFAFFPDLHQARLVHLTPEQRRRVRLIEEDYQLLQHEIHARAGGTGIYLPEDREALRLLEEEKRRDLAALLGPDALLEYDLRNSSTSHMLRHSLRAFDPDEEEFRAIFRLRQEIDLTFGTLTGPPGRQDEETRRQREAMEKAMEDQLRQLLGEERFADFQRSQDHAFTSLAGLTDRLGLPRETAVEIHQLQNLVQEKHREFQADPELTPEDRLEANQLLWQETRRTVAEALGEEGFEIYRNQGGWWLQRLERQAQATP